jgi:hypothetical protein
MSRTSGIGRLTAFGVKARSPVTQVDLASPSLNLAWSKRRARVNASHFGIQVASSEDVMEAKTRFEAASLETFSEEDTSCCYALQDKVWIEDPDGNSWEVFVVKGDADVMESQPQPAKAAPCCDPGCCATSKLD